MKKIIASVLAFLCMFNLVSIICFADEWTTFSKYSSFVTVRIDKNTAYSQEGWYKNMVRNPYYQKYYNELLDHSYAVYEKTHSSADNKEYIAFYTGKYVVNPENYVTLILKKSENPDVNIRDYNMNILTRYFEDNEILYVSDNTYAAVVCVSDANSGIFTDMTELEYIGDAFFSSGYTVLMPAIGTYTLGNVYISDGDGMGDSSDVDAADARFLLRYIAGLENVGMDKNFYFCADMDFDNDIDAADARLVLRTAANLEDNYFLSFNYFQFWTDPLNAE